MQPPSISTAYAKARLAYPTHSTSELVDEVAHMLGLPDEHVIEALSAETKLPNAEHTMSTLLKPCPHCGSNAKLNTITDDPEGPNHQGNYIACEACGASTQLMFSTGEDCRQILAQLWNARQGDGQHARDSAELRRLCQALDDELKARKAAQGMVGNLLSELIICRNDLARQAGELRQSVTVPGTDAIMDEQDESLCEFEESRVARLDALIAKAKGEQR